MLVDAIYMMQSSSCSTKTCSNHAHSTFLRECVDRDAFMHCQARVTKRSVGGGKLFEHSNERAKAWSTLFDGSS